MSNFSVSKDDVINACKFRLADIKKIREARFNRLVDVALEEKHILLVKSWFPIQYRKPIDRQEAEQIVKYNDEYSSWDWYGKSDEVYAQTLINACKISSGKIVMLTREDASFVNRNYMKRIKHAAQENYEDR